LTLGVGLGYLPQEEFAHFGDVWAVGQNRSFSGRFGNGLFGRCEGGQKWNG
jgi:hypothetical protein